MLTVLFAAKGGQGVTTTVAALAATWDGLVIDAAGDIPAALGVPEPTGPGLAGLLASDGPIDAGALVEAALVTSGLPVIPSGGTLEGFETGGGPTSPTRCRLIVAIGSSTPGPDPP